MRHAILIALCLLCACSSGPTILLVPGDAPCVNACKILSAYDCPEAKDSPQGRPCVDVCAAIAQISTQPECIVRAESLEAIRACGVQCQALK